MINLTWAESDNKLLIWKFGQRWSRIDFLNACQKSRQMVESADHRVNILIDLSESRFYPTNLIYLTRTGMRMRSENTGQVMIVSESLLWLRLYQHFMQVYPMNSLPVEFMSSYHEAIQALQTSAHDSQGDDHVIV